jgi:glutathione synthase/RimK-type ligase-like ATP-grasp enzyme
MRVSRTTNLDTVIKYFNNTFPLFIKPISGAGSMDAYKIENVKELQTKLESLFKIKQDGSLKYETFLVQEYIEGEQYIINFYTYKGTPYFTDAWIYKREITEKNGVVFRNVVFINKITPRVQEMIEYCSKTIMACNHQLGAVHAEIVFDSKDNGPILIEHNWRQMGATMFMDAPVIDGKYSNNEFLLQATINPNKVLKELEIVDYTNTKFFAPILIHRGPETKLLKFHDFVYRNLRSFSRFLPITLENTKIRYTNNFDDSLAAIDLIHDDYEVISKDQELIWEINENYDEVLYETTDNL